MFKTLFALALPLAANAAPCPATFRIHPTGHDNYCVTVAKTTDNPAPAYVTTCDGSAGQLWKFETPPYATDINHLRTADAIPQSTCLTAEVYRVIPATNGRQLALTGCYNDGAQSWSQTSFGGPIKMRGQIDNRGKCHDFGSTDILDACMDLRDGNLNGGAVQLWYCYDGNPNQQWTIESYGTH